MNLMKTIIEVRANTTKPGFQLWPVAWSTQTKMRAGSQIQAGSKIREDELPVPVIRIVYISTAFIL